MENFKPIDLHQARDFSRKMNATFEFIRQNIKSLGKSILFIAGPPVLIVSVLIGSFMGDFMSLSQASMGNPDGMSAYFTSVNFWLQLLLMVLFLLVSGVMTIATINSYIILYGEKRTNLIEVQEVWERVRKSFWMYVATMFLFVVLAIFVYMVLMIPFALIVAISPWLVFLAVIAFMCGITYLAFSVSLTFFIRDYEKKGFFESIRRSYQLVQGKWWSTFGLLMILYLIMMTISYVFIIPWYVVTIVNAIHGTEPGIMAEPSPTMQVLTVVFFSLYYLTQMILNTLPNIGIAFQYFNLVELKEAKGLMSEIHSIGQADTPLPSQEEHY